MLAEAEISIGYYRGPVEDVLTGIDRAALRGAVLEIEAFDSAELYELVEARTANRPDLAEENRQVRYGKFRIGPIKFGPLALVLPVEAQNVAELLALVKSNVVAVLELNVRAEDRYLVMAPDVGDNEIWVSRDLPADSVAALRNALGSGLRPVE